MDRGKRRSRAQRIGRKGEAIFESWATDRGLSANKVDEDYGIDFFCQVLRPVGTFGSEEATGAVIAVQVKAIEGDTRPRVKLERTDAINLLRQNHAVCLVAVHLQVSSVKFLFLDENLIKKLNEFMASSNDSLSIRLDEMNSDVNLFDKMLSYHCKPGTIQRLMILKAEQHIATKIPGSSLSIQQDKSGGSAIIDVPWFGSAFRFNSERPDVIRKMIFEDGKLPQNLKGLLLKTDLKPVHNLVDGSVMIRGKFERESVLTLENKGTISSATFQLRLIDDEWAYSNPVGLCFIVSDRRKNGKLWIHALDGSIFSSKQSLGQLQSLLPFLRLLKKGTQLSIDGKPFIPVESWGDTITQIGPAIEVLEKITSQLKLNLDDFCLYDFVDEEFGRSISLLDAVILRNTPLKSLINAFIIGPLSEKNPESIPTESVFMTLPLVINLKTMGIVLWTQTNGTVYLNDENMCCGLRFGKNIDWTFEMHSKFVKKSVYPELWINKHWPPIKLGEIEKPDFQPHKIKTKNYITFEGILKRRGDEEDFDVL